MVRPGPDRARPAASSGPYALTRAVTVVRRLVPRPPTGRLSCSTLRGTREWSVAEQRYRAVLEVISEGALLLSGLSTAGEEADLARVAGTV